MWKKEKEVEAALGKYPVLPSVLAHHKALLSALCPVTLR